jgi:hypothetical protein
MQATPAHRPAAARALSRPQNRNNYVNRFWENMNVAFLSPQQWEEGMEPEGLPLPMGEYEAGEFHSMGPMGPPYLDPGVPCADGSCSTHGMPGCGDACGCGTGVCGCEPGCGCGGICEPGCGCEPSCGCGSCGGSNHCCDGLCLGIGDDQSCHTIRVRVPKWQELMIFGGAHGFKGPYDQFRDGGNFGFNEGINAGFKIPFTSMGYQLGYRAVHSQLSGDENTDTRESFTQHFVTAGLFQRVKDGFQWGIAWDVLSDDRFGTHDYHQLRGEFSFVDRGCHELGVALAFHLNENEFPPEDSVTSTTFYQATDQYLLFYRFHGPRGGEGRIFGGFNDDDDGIIGADTLVPVSDRWSLTSSFTYLIPEEDAGVEGASQEAWNISVGLAWHWDCRARRSHSNCYRPLFNVADNGYLIVDDRPGAQVVNGPAAPPLGGGP